MLRIVEITTGNNQLGLRARSANVVLGENRTPKMRPIGDMAACGSATGEGTVAIEESSIRREIARNSLLGVLRGTRQKISHLARRRYLQNDRQRIPGVLLFRALSHRPYPTRRRQIQKKSAHVEQRIHDAMLIAAPNISLEI